MGEKNDRYRGKKTIVLNLDETLIHSKFGRHEDWDKFFSFKGETNYYAMSMYKRPFLDEFLEHLFDNFEVVFYTSAIEQYSNMVLDEIDPDKKAVSRLFRDSWLDRDGIYLKTIDRLRRNPSTVIVLENNPLKVWFNINNVFPIKSWFGDKKDKELRDLIPILDSLSKVKDVRKIIGKIFAGTGVTHAESNKIVNDLYQDENNIAKNNRYAYSMVMGNYYEPMTEYDPHVLAETYKQGKSILIKDKDKKYPEKEVNFVIFWHALKKGLSSLKTEDELEEEVVSTN